MLSTKRWATICLHGGLGKSILTSCLPLHGPNLQHPAINLMFLYTTTNCQWNLIFLSPGKLLLGHLMPIVLISSRGKTATSLRVVMSGSTSIYLDHTPGSNSWIFKPTKMTLSTTSKTMLILDEVILIKYVGKKNNSHHTSDTRCFSLQEAISWDTSWVSYNLTHSDNVYLEIASDPTD